MMTTEIVNIERELRKQDIMGGLIHEVIVNLERAKIKKMIEHLERLKKIEPKNETERACRPVMIKALEHEIDLKMKYLARWGEKL